MNRRDRIWFFVEALEDRANPVSLSDVSGAFLEAPLMAPADVVAVPATEFAFVGALLSIPSALAEGRTLTVAFADGTVAAGSLVVAGDDRTNVVVARNLPLAGVLAGEIVLANPADAADRIVIGFQLAIASNAATSMSSQTVVQSTPTYASGGANVPSVPPAPAVPPPPTVPPAPRPAAPIAQAAFAAGPTLAALESAPVRGVRTVVPLAGEPPIPPTATRVELGYSFLRSAGPIAFDPTPRTGAPISSDPTESTARSESPRVALRRTADSTHLHGIAVELPIVDVRDTLARIAHEDAPDAIWMEETAPPREAQPTDRRPFWAVAALLGLGASQYFRRRDGAIPELAML